MKNLGFFKTTVLAIGLTIAVASCSKENAPVPQNPPSNGDETKVLGQISDYGPLSSSAKGELLEELREMRVSFTNIGEVLNETTNEVRFRGKEVNVTLIVDADDMIPTGGYVFYSGEVPQSYTLKGGTAKITSAEDQMLQYDLNVTGGYVQVQYDGNTYSFFFQLSLDNGEILRGSAEGKMIYMDVHP